MIAGAGAGDLTTALDDDDDDDGGGGPDDVETETE